MTTKAKWTWGIAGLLLIVALIGWIAYQTNRAATTILTPDASIPTSFEPLGPVFCGLLQPYKTPTQSGLQGLVDKAQLSQPNPDLMTLKFAVVNAPNVPTHTAMIGLYKQVIDGHANSAAAVNLITQIRGMNPCA